ncbi:circadian clock-controlled protein daywake-like [Aricia agestis]|uniref:circadian clock-controlled protein daywake-like n=1 Tax=Aricia agestis TaxID=91739 RepID=UPI001C201AC2|nr:circadian clock-controlled protein daywake-like [Aricia agestis]
MVVNILLAAVLCGSLVESSYITSCKAGDHACVVTSANEVYQKLMVGVPELGIDPQEPVFHPIIEGDLSILNYKFLNGTFVGLDKCKMLDVQFDESTLKVHLEMTCPKIVMTANYEISGRLIVLPIEGEGECSVVTGRYDLSADLDVKISESNGKRHMAIKTFKLKPNAMEPIVFDFKNLFNGQKDLSDTVHKFANANWKEVAEFVQGPVWYTHGRKLVNAANKFLKNVGMDEITV